MKRANTHLWAAAAASSARSSAVLQADGPWLVLSWRIQQQFNFYPQNSLYHALGSSDTAELLVWRHLRSTMNWLARWLPLSALVQMSRDFVVFVSDIGTECINGDTRRGRGSQYGYVPADPLVTCFLMLLIKNIFQHSTSHDTCTKDCRPKGWYHAPAEHFPWQKWC